jgi:hypothetical protein
MIFADIIIPGCWYLGLTLCLIGGALLCSSVFDSKTWGERHSIFQGGVICVLLGLTLWVGLASYIVATTAQLEERSIQARIEAMFPTKEPPEEVVL